MRRCLTRIVPIAATASLLLAVGCGGDGSGDGDDSAEQLSKKEFIAQADRICAEGDAAIDQGGLEFPGATGEQLDELVGTVIAPGYRDQIEQLRELSPPAGDAGQVQEWLDTFEQGVEQLEANPDQLAGGPALDTIIESRGLAADYGMVDCARGA